MANTEQAEGLNFGRDARVTTTTGILVGAALGAIIGNNVGDGNAGTGAVVGAVLGGAAGLAIGQVAEQRRAAFTSESAYLDCEINTARQAVAQRDADVAQAQAQLDAMKLEVEALNQRAAQNNASRQELRAMRRQLNDQVAAYNQQLANCQREMDYYDQISQGTAPGAGLDRRRQQLAEQRGQLQTRFNDLNRIRDETQLAANSVGRG